MPAALATAPAKPASTTAAAPAAPAADTPSPELLAAARRFGLRPATAVRLTGGHQNPTYLLRTRSGRADVLRQYSPYRLGNGFRNDRAILWEHALLRHLADAGLPVLPPIPLKNGDTLLSLGAARWSRFRYAPSTQSVTPGTAGLRPEADNLAAARLLADIHLAARSFAPPPALAGQRAGMGERLDIGDWFMRLNNTPHSLDEVLAAARQPAPDSPHQKTWFRHLDWILFALELVQAARDDAELRAVPRQATHGDYWHLNFGYDERGISVVYDFDEGALDLRLIDVAKFISYSSHLPTGSFDLIQAERMLAAYQERFPLTEPELRHLVPAMISVRLFYILSTLAQQVTQPAVNHAWGWDFWGRAVTWIIAQRHEWTALATRQLRRSRKLKGALPMRRRRVAAR